MSAVKTMQSLSLLSSLIAWDWTLVKLGWGWEDLRTLLISALCSSASCWPNLVHTDSMAVMYSRLGGCLRETTKLGPLASADLWAWVKCLLDKLITHFGLGSSSVLRLGEPWGLSTLVLAACLLAWGSLGSSAISLGVSADCLRRGMNYLGVSALCLGTTCLWGDSAISLGDSADCLRICADCLGSSVICLGTTCLNRAISLGVSAGYLWRGADCLGVSILCLGTTCLWRDSAVSLEVSADCLRRGIDCLGISTLCLGTTCLRGNSASTACLGISPVSKPSYISFLLEK